MGRRGVGGTNLGGALEPLFVACALDDLVALAVSEPCPLDAVLLPQPRDLCLDVGVLAGEARVVPLAQIVEELGPPLGQPFDLDSDFSE